MPLRQAQDFARSVPAIIDFYDKTARVLAVADSMQNDSLISKWAGKLEDAFGDPVSPCSGDVALAAFFGALCSGGDDEIVGTAEAALAKLSGQEIDASLRQNISQARDAARARIENSDTSSLPADYLENLLDFQKSYPWVQPIFSVRPHVAVPWCANLPEADFANLLDEFGSMGEDDRLILVVDAWMLDWKQLGEALAGREVLLLFPETSVLLRLASQSDFVEFAKASTVGILIGTSYPAVQLSRQGWFDGKTKAISFVCLPSLYGFSEYNEVFSKVLSFVLSEACSDESPANNSFYRMCLSCCRIGMESKFGTSSAIAVERYWSNLHWTDRYKGEDLDSVEGISSQDTLQLALDELAPVREVGSRSLPGRPIRVCHLVTQLVSEGHAPTKLARTLCLNADRERFEPSVVSAESLARWNGVFPSSPFSSPSSKERGAAVIEKLAQAGIETRIVEPGLMNYIEGAKAVATLVEQLCPDVLVTHGDDPLIYMVARLCQVPMKVYVEHSARPAYAGFEVGICSIAGTAVSEQSNFDAWGTKLFDNPYGVDCRSEWPESPPDLKLPAGFKIMTTISNHLEPRLSDSFLQAVATILDAVPNAIYLPIGPVKDPLSLKARFEPYGVANRVFFAGGNPVPSNLCRCMNLYLNEFPFGGGISILDGMSAGLPVVSMHDPDGPMQAQNGANYIGLDRVLAKDDIVGYVTLAHTLLTDDAAWSEWSNHSLAEYEKRGPKPFVDRFEKILWESFER